MDLKHGSRIVLKNSFIQSFINKDDLSSQTFVIVAVTDFAVAMKNLRSNRMYTLQTEAVVRNIEQEIKVSSPTNTDRPIVTLDLPSPKPRPAKPVIIAKTDGYKLKWGASAKTSVSKTSDIFSYLYDEAK